MSTHENLTRFEATPTASERQFGIVFAVVFAVVACWPLRTGGAVRWWAAAISAAFLAAAFLWPSLLAPANRLWTRFGLLLHRVTSPVILGLLFYGVVTPIGVIARRMGGISIRTRRDPAEPSYWVPANSSGLDPAAMRKPF
jgi:hypothetical protein